MELGLQPEEVPQVRLVRVGACIPRQRRLELWCILGNLPIPLACWQLCAEKLLRLRNGPGLDVLLYTQKLESFVSLLYQQRCHHNIYGFMKFWTYFIICRNVFTYSFYSFKKMKLYILLYLLLLIFFENSILMGFLDVDVRMY